jgi:hypothetical protein
MPLPPISEILNLLSMPSISTISLRYEIEYTSITPPPLPLWLKLPYTHTQAQMCTSRDMEPSTCHGGRAEDAPEEVGAEDDL